MKTGRIILCILFFAALLSSALCWGEDRQPIRKTITTIYENDSSDIQESMEIPYDKLSFSNDCYIYGDFGYRVINKLIWSEDLWTDFKLFNHLNIKKVFIYMNCGGGNVFAGLGMANEIQIFNTDKVEIVMEARGIIASAAVPIFLMGDKRTCSKDTIFLIHPQSLFKGGYFSETIKDLESQTRMMEINRENYVNIIVSKTNLEKEKVEKMMEINTWFTAKQALEWGFVDEIVGKN